MKTTEPESQDSKGQKQKSAPEQTPRPSGDFPDPDFPIEGTGGPTDTGGGAYSGGPPPKG